MTDSLDSVYEQLGVTTLERAIDEGPVAAHCTALGHENYGRVAAAVVHEPDAEHVTQLAELMGDQIAAVLMGDTLSTDEQGRTWVRFPWLDEAVELTPKVLEHWQWLRALATSPDLARRLLDTLPVGLRDQIEADIAERAEFHALTAPLARMSDQTGEVE